ncbi:hypothetical protein G6F68_017571 [Rhizopus microsporus]|nr:hypothetical protein G6F68_017571 [Rhizopus microsporus]
MARLQLQAGFFLGAGRQHLLVTMQLGRQMPAPALRVPAIPARRQFGLVEYQGQARRGQHGLKALQRILDGRLQGDHHDLRTGILQQLRLQAVRVVFQHQLHIGVRQCLAQALTRRTRAGKQGDGRGRMGFTHGHGRSPAGRTRYASGPGPGKACPGSAGQRSRRRAGGACRRCAR